MKKIIVLSVLFLSFTSVKSQKLEAGNVYVIYEKEVKSIPENKNSGGFFYVIENDDDKGLTICEAIFDKERGKFFISMEFDQERDIEYLKRFMTTPLLPALVEEGEVLIPKYK
jgi:hypothetical protein